MNIFTQLHRDESDIPYAYQDPLGYWTIGVGHLIDKRKGGQLSDRIRQLILEEDVAAKQAELAQRLPWLADDNSPRYWALVNMAFQLGVDGLLEFKHMLESFKDGRYEDAARQALISKWAQQTPARAKRVSEQIRTGDWV